MIMAYMKNVRILNRNIIVLLRMVKGSLLKMDNQ